MYDSNGSDSDSSDQNNIEYRYSQKNTKLNLTPQKAEEIFLAELEEKKAMLGCNRCHRDHYVFNPVVSRIIHHKRPGGTSYMVSGNCSKCNASIWECLVFERNHIKNSIPDFKLN